MAQISTFIIKAFVLAAFVAAAVSGQELGVPPPAPSPDAGAGFSLLVSTAVVGTSLMFCLLTLFRH